MTSPAEIRSILERAVALHQSGRLDAAEQEYLSVLALDSANADANNLLGLIAMARAAKQDAVRYFDKAISSAPKLAALHFNRANALVDLGAWREAEEAYRRAVALQPTFTDALLNLGALLFRQQRYAEAERIFREFVARCPSDVRGFKNLGRALMNLGDYDGAEAAFSSALKVAPNDIDCLVKLANTFARTSRFQEAVNVIDRAIRLDPANGEHHSNRGTWLQGLGRFDEAVVSSSHACALDPRRAEFFFNCGNVYYANANLDLSLELFRKAIEINPRFANAYVNMGEVLKDLGRTDEALAALDAALAMKPDSSAARVNKAAAISNVAARLDADGEVAGAIEHYDAALAVQGAHPANIGTIRTNKALALLAAGRFKEGWTLYRHRFEQAKPSIRRREFPYPEWRGEPIAGKRMLLWTDQGPGDEVLYGSMVQDVRAIAGDCLLECSPRMAPLFARSFPGLRVVAQAMPPDPRIAAFCPDLQAAVPDLGEVFRQDLSAFPRHSGYLKAEPQLTAEIRRRYAAAAAGRLIVGVSWRSSNQSIGSHKSIALDDWKTLLETPEVYFVSLQYGETATDLDVLRSRLGVEIYSDPTIDALQNLDAFAAQVAALDLVISVSNTTVHFAGALNLPVWTLVPKGKGALWYFRVGDGTPWYPSMRLFRQTKANDWGDVLTTVKTELKRLIEGRSQP